MGPWTCGHWGQRICWSHCKRHTYDTRMIPSIMDYSALNSDISKMIYVILPNKKASDWSEYNHRCSQINVDDVKAVFATASSRNKSKIMVRLRMAHTQLTHDYILSGDSKITCFFCNTSFLSVDHLLDDCPKLNSIRHSIFGVSKPSTLFKSLKDSDIDIFINSFTYIKKYH